MNKPEIIKREKALKVLFDFCDFTFGNDKGSGMAYLEWAENNELCKQYDEYTKKLEENEDAAVSEMIEAEYSPPDWIEILIAAGINPQELYEAIPGINPECFPAEMCEAYGFKPIVPKIPVVIENPDAVVKVINTDKKKLKGKCNEGKETG